MSTIEIPHTIVLDFPFPYGKDDEVTEIVVERRLKAKDFKGIKAQDIRFDDMLRLICRMTNQPMSKIEELDSIDMMKAVEVVNGFLPSSQTDGGTG